LFAEEICAEYIFADEWPKNAKFCGWRFQGILRK